MKIYSTADEVYIHFSGVYIGCWQTCIYLKSIPCRGQNADIHIYLSSPSIPVFAGCIKQALIQYSFRLMLSLPAFSISDKLRVVYG
jgi:hypothetical protein